MCGSDLLSVLISGKGCTEIRTGRTTTGGTVGRSVGKSTKGGGPGTAANASSGTAGLATGGRSPGSVGTIVGGTTGLSVSVIAGVTASSVTAGSPKKQCSWVGCGRVVCVGLLVSGGNSRAAVCCLW